MRLAVRRFPWIGTIVLVVLFVVYALALRLAYRRGTYAAEEMEALLIMGIVVFFPLAVLLGALEQALVAGAIQPGLYRLVVWTPRIAMILFALLLGLFAFDELGQGSPLGQQILTLLIHLLPAFGAALAIVLAWRWEWVGALLLTGWAIAYPFLFPGFPLLNYVVISGLSLVLAMLFLLGWQQRTAQGSAGGGSIG